jgi:cyclase
MEVDEIVVLDIGATIDGTGIPFDLIGEMASECFMPMAYGGAVRGVEDVRRVLGLGVEKVVVNSAAASDAGVISGIADAFGSQAVVASVDVRRRMFRGYRAYSRGGRTLVKQPAVELAHRPRRWEASRYIKVRTGPCSSTSRRRRS